MEEKKVEKRPKKIGPVRPPQTPGASDHPTSTPNTSKHHVKMHPSTPHGHPDGHPANYYYSEDQIWGTNEEGDLLSISQPSTKHAFLDVFMPNGFLIPIQCPLSRTLAQLKQDIFIQGRKLPLSSHIKDISNYIFSTIGLDGVHLELYDEHKPVSSLHQCLPLLILREPDGNTEEKELAQNIGTAMGICLTEIEKHISEESRLFRLKLFETCKMAEAERGVHGLEHYAFPEEPLLPDKIVPPNTGRRDLKEIHELDLDYVQYPEEEAEDHALERLRQKIKFYGAYVEIWFRMDESKLEYLKPIQIRDVLEKTPSEVIHMSLRELKKYYNISESANDFILQIAGRTVFVTQEVFITQFQYIRSCFENYRIPKLILRRKQAVFKHYQPPPKIFEPSYVRKEKHSQYFKMEKDRQQTRVFWDLDDNLKVKILSASQLSNLAVGEDIFIRVSVAVGRHILDVKDVEPVSPSNPRWKLGTIEFDVYLKDIPECTQLCFSLISLRKKKSRVELKPIGWMNLYIFDWRHHLVQGKQSLNLWPFPKGCTLEDVTFLSGAYAFNFNDATVACRIEIELPEYEAIIEYPNQPIIDKFIKVIEAREAEEATTKPKINKFVPGNPDLDRVLLLRRTLDASKLTVEEQLFIWAMRYKIRDLFPQMILVLADCAVVWQEREKICEFYNLLRSWPSLNVDTAVELLDGRYVDLRLRAMAIEHLDNSLNDDQLRLYLLVLIQAIRYEPHMDSPLVNMLVRRSLLNYHVGHTVFWLLRAELAHFVLDPACSKITPLYIRFALMLEAYCRGNSAHLDSLMKQVTMMSTLTTLSITIRGIGNKDIANKKLQQELFLRKDSLQNMCSPLNPTDSLGELIVENCRVLGSAKMPLKLTWTNPELLSEISIPTHELIFKNGDDMRQDMLTLQVMRIMDAKWKNHNIDYCMTLYEVLPMGRNIGLIQVVQNCQTLYQIQCVGKQVGSSLNMDVASLNKHIYQKCAGDSKQYMECVDRFAGSLAGYCIATYVIGIKDRHHDNIMLAQDGRIFHIDFGHFLGHTKTKLGINRERTEFILTDHFLYVISKGKNNFKNTHEYNIFRESTTRGFMIIYHHARFFIALFRMMLCMGLPELTDDDVTFLRSSLMYDEMDRDKAGTAFKHIFEEVVKSDWATSINWFFHSVKHI